MKIRFKRIITAIAVIPLLTGCNVYDPIYDANRPNRGKITVTADWSGIEGGAGKPSSWWVKVGAHSSETSSDKYVVPKVFDPGTYDLLLHNEVAEMEITDTLVSVQVEPTSQDVSASCINAFPGWFFSGTAQVEVGHDTDHEFTVAMCQQVRQLNIVIKPKGDMADHISSIEATLTGIAGMWDMAGETPVGDPAVVALHFTKIPEGNHAGSWIATVRLLGITGTHQKLSGTISFTDSNPAGIVLYSDLSTDLVNFNMDKKRPLTLGGEVDILTTAGFTAIITEWKPVGGTGIAE